MSELHRQSRLDKWNFDQETKKISKLLSDERTKIQELKCDHESEIKKLKADCEQSIALAIKTAEHGLNRHNLMVTHNSSLLEDTVKSLTEEL